MNFGNFYYKLLGAIQLQLYVLKKLRHFELNKYLQKYIPMKTLTQLLFVESMKK